MDGRVPVRRGGELLGWVRLTGQDGYWTLGTFEPAAGFESHRPLFARVLELSRQSTDVPAGDDCSASDEMLATLDEINELGLSVGEPGVPTRDFKLIGPGLVEFKWGT